MLAVKIDYIALIVQLLEKIKDDKSLRYIYFCVLRAAENDSLNR